MQNGLSEWLSTVCTAVYQQFYAAKLRHVQHLQTDIGETSSAIVQDSKELLHYSDRVLPDANRL